MPKFDAEQVARRRRGRATGVRVPGPGHGHLATWSIPRFDTAALDSVQLCTVGSAPLPSSVLERLQERMPTAHGLQQLRDDRGRFGLLHHAARGGGQAPGLGGQAGCPRPRCAAPTPTEPRCPAGQVGEVLLRIPGRPREYFGDPEATSRTWVDGWLVTGDLGKVDEDGYLYIVGRSKDVIIRGGNNIHPTDVEHVIEVPLGGAGGRGGRRRPPRAGRGRGGLRGPAPRRLRPTAEDLRAYTLEQLAAYKVPRRWQFVDELPRNATGKVVKHQAPRPARGPRGRPDQEQTHGEHGAPTGRGPPRLGSRARADSARRPGRAPSQPPRYPVGRSAARSDSPIPSSTSAPTGWPGPWPRPEWAGATGWCGWARTATG